MSSFFKAIDLFDKPVYNDDYRKENNLSVFLSILLTVLCTFLVVFQIVQIFDPKFVRDLSLKPTKRDESKLVNISLTILVDVPCYFLHMDSLDALGMNQLNINTTVSFIRISSDGKEISKSKYRMSDICLPCYGILPDDQCCNTCEELILYSRMRGLRPTPENWSQCNGKNELIRPEAVLQEKCLVKGKVTVNKVQGAFHIAPGRNVINRFGGHMHDLSIKSPNFNLSHTIERLYFGQKVPMASNPLNSFKKIQPTKAPTLFQYMMQVTPIKFYKNGKFIAKSFEYSALSINRTQMENRGVPIGLFFFYSFTPYTITITSSTPSIFQIITSTGGLISGLFAIAALIDATFNRQDYRVKILREQE